MCVLKGKVKRGEDRDFSKDSSRHSKTSIEIPFQLTLNVLTRFSLKFWVLLQAFDLTQTVIWLFLGYANSTMVIYVMIVSIEFIKFSDCRWTLHFVISIKVFCSKYSIFLVVWMEYFETQPILLIFYFLWKGIPKEKEQDGWQILKRGLLLVLVKIWKKRVQCLYTAYSSLEELIGLDFSSELKDIRAVILLVHCHSGSKLNFSVKVEIVAFICWTSATCQLPYVYHFWCTQHCKALFSK